MPETGNRFVSFFKKLGPGVITGASDDDPSGILTYLQAGTVLGLKAVWTALFTLPLMYGIQEMCARIGLVTDKGLMKIIKEHFSKIVFYPIAFVSVLVITMNIGADLSAVGVVLERLIIGHRLGWLVIVAALVMFFTVYLSYHRFARILKWLTLSLFFYVVTVFFLRVDWSRAFGSTFIINIDWSKNSLLLITAILGTTISPYLFFWQASEEVEERDEVVIEKHHKRFLVTKHELKQLKEDVFTGMLFSNLVTWFLIVGASRLSDLYGIKEITNFEQAAMVLKPLLGDGAYLMFSLGIIGTALLAIPVLAGSVGYILSEVFGLAEGVNKKFSQAKGFYLAIIGATVGGILVNFFHVDPVQLLIYTAVLYGVITPPIIYLILKIANSKKIMNHKVNNRLSNALGVISLLVMTAAAVLFLIS